jgi:hypothetical protein
MEKRWRESTQKLLIKDQIGSFDSLHWQLGETMILYWAEKEQNGIQKCFEILERLVDEAALNKEANFTMDIYIIHKGTLNLSSVNSMIDLFLINLDSVKRME